MDIGLMTLEVSRIWLALIFAALICLLIKYLKINDDEKEN